MNASLVFDGGTEVAIPESMGTPTPRQMHGTPFERLGELSSRICYDSLGFDEAGKPRGRPSEKLHGHILEVNNTSVHEHANFTLRIRSAWPTEIMLSCLNRKGVWVERGVGRDDVVDVTVGLRAVLEWGKYTTRTNTFGIATPRLAWTVRAWGHKLAPMIVGPESGETFPDATLKTEGLTDDQAWVSLYLYGSRGFGNEQVRHRFAISQRSTRYVDEDGSPYIMHPLVSAFLADQDVPVVVRLSAESLIAKSVEGDRQTYRTLVGSLEKYLLDRGMDRQTARKQARGASRGYLGIALATEMIFSASVANWRWILRQRKNKAADAEIRAVYSPGLAALKASRYGDRFADFIEVASPDGLGTVLA